MSFTVATFHTASLAALVGALAGIAFAFMSQRTLTRSVVGGLLATLVVATCSAAVLVGCIAAFMIGTPRSLKTPRPVELSSCSSIVVCIS